jgi:hypothetical protein
MASEFKFISNSLITGLTEMSRKETAIYLKLETEAKSLEDYSKQHAPWTDRTGQARRSLNASIATITNGYRITLAHGVDYGKWLELAHEKRFAIVMPTIKAKGDEVVKSFENFLAKL